MCVCAVFLYDTEWRQKGKDESEAIVKTEKENRRKVTTVTTTLRVHGEHRSLQDLRDVLVRDSAKLFCILIIQPKLDQIHLPFKC